MMAQHKDGHKSFSMPEQNNAGRKVALFCFILVVWIVLDRLTKMQFEGLEPDGILAGPFVGMFDIRLVHNTGAAWGIFSDSTFALGIFSIIVCAILAGYFFATVRQANAATALGFGLVVAGGIGNAIDRFMQGYVVDFIEFSFMDFPVFNIADIGVTCGFVIVILGYIYAWRRQANRG